MNIFNNKKILITGHTGFKGSWLSVWLKKLGGIIIGLSDNVPTVPSHYDLFKNIIDYDLRLDVKNKDAVITAINKHAPDFIFHLAAQPIVFDAYKEPFNTFQVNTMGTATILEYLKQSSSSSIAVFVTSDKCYDNVEWTYGYRETDQLGGKDPYSGSKGAAELVIKSYFHSFISELYPRIKIGIGRAGNVIGGGDWAPFRIVPDSAKSWSANKSPEIRCPQATRPWQHVLEPLSGYLSLARALHCGQEFNGQAFNFGPPAHQNHSVRELVEEMSKNWTGTSWIDKSDRNQMPTEAGLLKLCCDKALHALSWHPTLTFKETAKWTAEWYKSYYKVSPEKAKELTLHQIENYTDLSVERKTFIT